jgi:hypothetical protein
MTTISITVTTLRPENRIDSSIFRHQNINAAFRSEVPAKNYCGTAAGAGGTFAGFAGPGGQLSSIVRPEITAAAFQASPSAFSRSNRACRNERCNSRTMSGDKFRRWSSVAMF